MLFPEVMWTEHTVVQYPAACCCGCADMLTQMFGLGCDPDSDFRSTLVLFEKRVRTVPSLWSLFSFLAPFVLCPDSVFWQLEMVGCSSQVTTEMLSVFVERAGFDSSAHRMCS